MTFADFGFQVVTVKKSNKLENNIRNIQKAIYKVAEITMKLLLFKGRCIF
jgi:hypothetical protein